MLNYSASVLSTIQAAAADISLTNNVLSITGCPDMDIRQITSVPSKAVAPVAETVGVQTITFTAVASTVYEFTVSQWVQSLNREVIVPFRYTSLASGDTATTIGDAFRSIIGLNDGGLSITASGGATLILTAGAGSPIFRILENSANIAVANTTPGVVGIGTYSYINNFLDSVGIVPTGTLASGHTYSTTTFVFNHQDGDSNKSITSSVNQHTLYADVAASNYAAFLIALVTTITEAGFDGVNGTTQNLSGAGAISVTQYATSWTTTAADAGTLADGVEGQWKLVTMIVRVGDGTLTPTSLLGYTTITFNTVGDTVLLRFQNGDWVVVANQGCTLA